MFLATRDCNAITSWGLEEYDNSPAYFSRVYLLTNNTTERLSWKLCHIPERDAKQVETMKV